ncbi:MAG: hypothetical protein AAFR16_09900, partial [Pseudomonadota bacterium]
MRRIIACAAAAVAACAAGDEAAADDRLVSAFFGLDDALPLRAVRLCPRAPGKDGMPVIFSEEIDEATLDAADFRVTTAAGRVGRVDCVT